MKDISTVDVCLAAMDLLAKREHSRLELSQKLNRRYSHQPDLVEEEISKLETQGLQSDFRLAETFVRTRTSRGQGPFKIRMELRRKGVPDDVITQAVEESGIDWFELVGEVAAKKFGDRLAEEPIDMKVKAKVARFLQQRGFSYDHISSLY